MSSDGVLILSHCGFSFIEKISAILAKQNIEVYVLSSLVESCERKQQLSKITHWLSITSFHALRTEDVVNSLEKLASHGKNVLACISVWEGYREIMAMANELLGAIDLPVNVIQKVKDKYILRKELNQHKLTHVNCDILTKKLLYDYRKSRNRKFVKPVTGLASLGAFELKADTSWEWIASMKSAFINDKVYGSIISSGTGEWIVEDFIEGVEVSFELIVNQSVAYVLAIHEKIEVELKKSTTLESACISPSVSLTKAEVSEGILLVQKVITALGLTTGCFHIEAKCHKSKWEIIEINPRIGGTLIHESVSYLTDGCQMLELWLSLLMSSKCSTADCLKALENFNAESTYKYNRHTFFRVYFAEQGAIAKVTKETLQPPPDIVNIFAKKGDVFESDAKENFLAEALWCFDESKLTDEVLSCIEESKRLISVEYVTNEVEQ